MVAETNDERMDRERLEALARASVGSDLPFDVKKCALCKKLSAVPKGRENCTVCRHPLSVGDLQRMNVPEEFWKVTVTEATDSTQAALRNYIKNFREFTGQGVGMYLFGKAGRGKTGAAVALLKAARERFKSGYFIRIAELRDAMQHQHDFDADLSIIARVREVDVLVMDSFTVVDLVLPYMKIDSLMELIAARGQRRKVTLLTTTLTALEVDERAAFFDTVGMYLVPVEVKGKNRRADRMEKLAEKLHAKLKPVDSKTKGRG